jgi:hypothetical protein
MAATKFFVFPFAVDGDRTVVPDEAQPSGSVSYEDGYTFDYQRNPNTDPEAIKFPRTPFNQILYDLTLALQQYQSIGTPNFITADDNLDAAFSYDKFAYALYDDGSNGPRPYQSLVNNNDTLPSDATKWRLIDNFGESVIYNNAVFHNAVVDKQVVYWDSANSRFDAALADGTAKQNVVGIADVTNKRVYGLGLVPIMTGLTPGAVYYLSGTTPGAIMTSVPISGLAVRLGLAKSPTQLFFNPVVYDVPIPIVANVYMSATQNLPANNVQVKLNFDTIDPNVGDLYGLWDAVNKRWLLKRIGYWRVTSLVFAANPIVFPSPAEYVVTLKLNGIEIRRMSEVPMYADNQCPPGFTVIKNTAVTDYLELWGSNNDPTSVLTVGATIPTVTAFLIEYLGPA